jgi:hypothetical protein
MMRRIVERCQLVKGKFNVQNGWGGDVAVSVFQMEF